METHLPARWQVEILLFTVGVRGSVAEGTWYSNMERLGCEEGETRRLLRSLVIEALEEFDGMLSTRRVALGAVGNENR